MQVQPDRLVTVTRTGAENKLMPHRIMLQEIQVVPHRHFGILFSQCPKCPQLLSFTSLDIPPQTTMAKSHSESSEDFEFIETPAAPTPQPAAETCGVRTTAVRVQLQKRLPDYLQ